MARREVTVTFTPAQVESVRGAIAETREALIHESGPEAATTRRTLGNALDRLDAADRRSAVRTPTAWERAR